MTESYPQDLVRHVAASTGLPEATATRVVADIAAYFAETVEEFVCRRHEELKAKQRKNDEIWPQLAAEIGARRFGAPALSERQLRRIVYDKRGGTLRVRDRGLRGQAGCGTGPGGGAAPA